MSYLDLFREELKRRGLSDAQANSKAVAVALDVLSQSGDMYTSLQKSENATSKRLGELSRAAQAVRSDIEYYEKRKRILLNEIEALNKTKAEVDDYARAFNKSLLECETAEGRDAIRRVQLFINNANVDTKYDNTAYIIALGAILSNGKIGAISELRKINKKIPAIPEDFGIPFEDV